MLKLCYRELSEEQAAPPLLFLHGLLGSSANWQTVARAFTDSHHVIIPDLRNHGRSPHADSCSYEAMSLDVLQLMDELGLAKASLVGHSMGGKLAMWLALNYPERVDRLLVADIAPVAYPDRFTLILDALRAIDLPQLHSRQQADKQLTESIADAAVRAYLLQNLLRTDSGWQWRVNLPALQAGLDQIMSFPTTRRSFAGMTLFLKGEHSDYILPDYTNAMQTLFPQMQIAVIRDAGHWVYAEQPQQFVTHLRQFLDGQDHVD